MKVIKLLDEAWELKSNPKSYRHNVSAWFNACCVTDTCNWTKHKNISFCIYSTSYSLFSLHTSLLVLNTANIILKADKIINYIVHGEKFYQELLPTQAQLPVV